MQLEVLMNEFHLMLKSGYKLILVQTSEEEIVAKKIKDLMVGNYKIKDFSLGQPRADLIKDLGTFVYGETNQRTLNDFEDYSPQDKKNKKQDGVFIIRDGNFYMGENDGLGQRVLRIMKDFNNNDKGKNVIIVISTSMRLPNSIQGLFSVLNHGLPTEEELVALIRDNFKKEFKLSNQLIEKIAFNLLGLNTSQAALILNKILFKNGTLDDKAIDTILDAKKEIISKDGFLEFFPTTETMDNIGGLENLKAWATLRTKVFSKTAAEFGIPFPKGMLIAGVQGTGKSLASKAMASLWKFPLLRLDMGKLFGGLVGQSEENTRRVIQVAEAVSPCVLWIDEIEKGFDGLNATSGDSGTSTRVLGTLLTWMQEKRKPVFVVATANQVEKLPPEMIRKGRFDEIFFVDFPNKTEREQIFKVLLLKIKRDPAKFNLSNLSLKSEGYTGAEIEQAITDSLIIAFDNGRDIKDDDIYAAIESMTPLKDIMGEKIDKLRNFLQFAKPANTNERENISKAKDLSSYL